jgi:Co/Zn/Cd efflux system component
LIICFDLRLGARRKPTATMGLSKTNRIIILLVIDTAFFLLELITGYAVHSLALVADSFHMVRALRGPRLFTLIATQANIRIAQ